MDWQYDGFLGDYVFSDDEVDIHGGGGDYEDRGIGGDRDEVEDCENDEDRGTGEDVGADEHTDDSDNQSSDSDSMPSLCADWDENDEIGSSKYEQNNVSEYFPYGSQVSLLDIPEFKEQSDQMHTGSNTHAIDWWYDWERSLMYYIHVVKGGCTPEEFEKMEEEYESDEQVAYDMHNQYYDFS